MHVPTIAIEKYEAKDHEQRMIVELLGDIIMPCETAAEIAHPHANHYHYR